MEITPNTKTSFTLNRLTVIILAIISGTAFILLAYTNIIYRLEKIELYDPKQMSDDILLIKKDVQDIKEVIIPQKEISKKS